MNSFLNILRLVLYLATASCVWVVALVYYEQTTHLCDCLATYALKVTSRPGLSIPIMLALGFAGTIGGGTITWGHTASEYRLNLLTMFFLWVPLLAYLGGLVVNVALPYFE